MRESRNITVSPGGSQRGAEPSRAVLLAVLAGGLSPDCEDPRWFPFILYLVQDSFPTLASRSPELAVALCCPRWRKMVRDSHFSWILTHKDASGLVYNLVPQLHITYVHLFIYSIVSR